MSLPDGVGRCIKPAPSLVPRQLPNPVAVVGFQKGGHAFKNLICVQTPDHDGRGCMHHKRHEKRQRQDDAPDADHVHFDDEKCVPAAADDAVIGGHLISHADADDTQDDEKSICISFVAGCRIVDREDRDTDEKQCNAGQYTNAIKTDAAAVWNSVLSAGSAPEPTAFPIMTEAVEEAPTAVDLMSM